MQVRTPQDDWDEYRALILAELKRLSESINDVRDKIDRIHNADISEIKQEIAVLKVKAGLWGAVAGSVPGIIYLLLNRLGL